MHITHGCFRGYRTHPMRLTLTGDGGDCTCREAFALASRIARRPASYRKNQGRAAG
jgi:hypothetical protein